MMSSCDNGKAGFSLLEVLIVLGILSLAIAAFATTSRSRSPSLELKAHVSELHADVAFARATAIVEKVAQTIELTAPICPGSFETLTFFPDGTAEQADICLFVGVLEHHLKVDPLTAQLVLMEAR